MASIQQIQIQNWPRGMRAVALSLALLMACGISFALSPMEEDARSFSMEVATPYVGKGFKVRAEQWSGEAKSGEKQPVKFQLFKGNEYWFWGGSSDERSRVRVNVYDTSGKTVASRKIRWKRGMGGVRVIPPATGTYIAVVTVESKSSAANDEKVGWALAYGYR